MDLLNDGNIQKLDEKQDQESENKEKKTLVEC